MLNGMARFASGGLLFWSRGYAAKGFNAEDAEGAESWESTMVSRRRDVMGGNRDKAMAGIGAAAGEIFLVNERMNQMVIENLAPESWRAKTAGGGRSIVAIFTHVHNVRCKWVRLTAPHLKVPRKLDRARCTARQAMTGLAQSAAACAEMLGEALGGDGGRIKEFLRDGWARPWRVGPEMLCYMIAHEAHHRGQVFMLARQLGYELPEALNYEVWNWEKLLKEARGAERAERRSRRK
jgi:uncharacterized damage-inducible protein DinB